jgi:hypothetical protein
MTLYLEAIQFNHDSSAASSDALNLRRNATQFVTVPEWRRGISSTPEDSPAAYAIQETQGHTLTIKAQFRSTDPEIQTVYIRAIDPKVNPPDRGGCLGWLIRLLYLLLHALFGNVLGEVKARKITFPAGGVTQFETFQLHRVRLWGAGIGVRTTIWQWQYRLSKKGKWKNLTITRHRIYSVLAVPTAPWQQTPYNSANLQLPWTEVLDYACSWAFLKTSRDAAAARVTQAVYDLGPSIVVYDCPGGGSSHYALGSFNCTAFLERLSGGIGNGQYVNCTDCATIVSTFANILGCDLWQSRMGWGFDLNPLLAIGSAIWQTACGWGGFSYHEVAWKNACTASDEVFDACLQVDSDADPTGPPHTGLLPTNMVFGAPGDGLYRSRLCPPSGQPACAPQPATRTRRSVI